MTPAEANIAIAEAVGHKGETVPDYWHDLKAADPLRDLVTDSETLETRSWAIGVMTTQNSRRLSDIIAEGYLRAKGLWT